MPLSISDGDIIQKLKAGDTYVFKYCYPIAFPQVKSMVQKHGGISQDAEDIFQEALIVFYRNAIRDDFELTAALSTYIYAVSYRLWLKQLRKRKPSVEISDAEDRLVDTFHFELAEEESDKLGEVLEVMESAGKRCKEILTLFYFNKLKYGPIAEKLGMKDERAVREQKYRCMKRIKEAINQQTSGR